LLLKLNKKKRNKKRKVDKKIEEKKREGKSISRASDIWVKTFDVRSRG